MPIAQGRHGYVTIAGVDYPVFDWAMSAPRNIVTGNPLGNTWGTNFAEGLQTTRFTARMMVRTKNTEILTVAKTFWNLFLARPFALGFDDTATSTIVASTGRRTRTLLNAKAESFTLTLAKGAPVGLTVVFVAPSVPTLGDVTPVGYTKTFDNSPLLMFNNATITGVTGGVYGLELTYSNNHLVDAPLDGTKYATNWDAGVQTCGLSVTVPEHQAANEPFADGATIAVALAGATTNTLTMKATTPNNPKDVTAGVGQIFQRYDCIVQGDAANPPLAIS